MFARLGFAVAIHVDADVFLADEVLAVGDRPFKRKCMAKMQEIRDSGTTLFYVSHATASVRKMCDRVLVLEKGRLGFDGDVDEGIQLPPLRRRRRRGARERRRGVRRTRRWAPTSETIAHRNLTLRRRVDWKLQVCSYSETVSRLRVTSVKLATRVTLPPHWSSRNDPLALALRHGLSAAAGPGRGAGCAHARRPVSSRSTWSDPAPSGPRRPLAHPTARLAAYTAEAVRPSQVPTAPVKPDRPRGPADLGRHLRRSRACRHLRRPRRRRARRCAAAHHDPAAGHRLRRGRRDLGAGRRAPADGAQGRGSHPHPRQSGRLAHRSPTTPSTAPTQARPRPGRPGPAPTRCWWARSDSVQVRAVSDGPCRRT